MVQVVKAASKLLCAFAARAVNAKQYLALYAALCLRRLQDFQKLRPPDASAVALACRWDLAHLVVRSNCST